MNILWQDASSHDCMVDHSYVTRLLCFRTCIHNDMTCNTGKVINANIIHENLPHPGINALSAAQAAT